MNRREKILAVAVGILVLGAGLNFVTSRIAKMLSEKSDEITRLETSIKEKKVFNYRGAIARRLLNTYEKRSLPGNRDLANSYYRAWLHHWVEQANIRNANVEYVSGRPYGDFGVIHLCVVTCKADLPQLVDLLFRFYSTDYLHRIKHMSAKPLEGKVLQLAFTIEAISLPGVPLDKKLTEMPSDRLAFKSLDDYTNVIVNRNLYSPANQPPKFASSGTKRGYLNQRMSIRPKAQDPEKGRLTYRLGDHHLEGLKIDEKSGEIVWTPDKKGEFELLVYATDDGLPAKETSQTIKLEVTDPPPQDTGPARPSFDEAKYTFVTGIVEKDGRREVWLTVRTDGQWLRLAEGDTFKIGTFDGKILRIHLRSVEIQSGSTRMSVRYGQNLSEGRILSDTEEDVATAAK